MATSGIERRFGDADGGLSAVAGPSRPRRSPVDLGDRIVALQRKNASAPGPSRAPLRPLDSSAPSDEYSRGPPPSSHRPLFDPSRPIPPSTFSPAPTSSPLPRVSSPQPLPARLGPPGSPARSAARLAPPPPTSPGRIPRESRDGGRRSQPSPSRYRDLDQDVPRHSSGFGSSAGPSRTGSAVSRQLFDPSLHDPHAFSRPTPPPPLPASAPAPAPAPSNTSRYRHTTAQPGSLEPPPPVYGEYGRANGYADTVSRNPLSSQSRLPEMSSGYGGYGMPSVDGASSRRSHRVIEEDADRERERRRRKEGSERGGHVLSGSGSGTGSGSSGRKKDDGRSKGSRGSRSSEGSESFKDRERGKGKGDSGVKAILKDVHDRIKSLETELTDIHKRMAAHPEAGIIVLSEGKDGRAKGDDRDGDEDMRLWMELIWKHKQLADLHHDFLIRIFDPLVPSSLHQLTIRYNIPSRLWQTAFHLILERLRHAWMTTSSSSTTRSSADQAAGASAGDPVALDLLTDFVYDAYKFYTDLLEDQALSGFRTAWIEALGDLARYRMAIANKLSQEGAKGKGKDRKRQVPSTNNADAISDEEGDAEKEEQTGIVQDGASIGAEVASHWDVEDSDTWRQTARDWYSMGITEKPGEGRLHHHLALLVHDVPAGQGRALHHFLRSLGVTHEFPTARESILGLFDMVNSRQASTSSKKTQSARPSTSVMDTFIRLHGMLFTRIELDRFDRILSELMAGMESGEVGQVDWMIMASACLAGMMQYGLSEGVLRQALAQESVERRRAQATTGEAEQEGELGTIDGDIDGAGPAVQQSAKLQAAESAFQADDPDTWPLQLVYAFRLAFSLFSFALAHPTLSQGSTTVLNPFLTIFLTFLATLSRQPPTAAQIILPWIPWTPLLTFVNETLPRLSLETLEVKPETKLVGGQALPEDWLLRGSEWVGRRVYERGFWKTKSTSNRGSGGITLPTRAGERFTCETDVLLAHYEVSEDASMGVVETEGKDEVDGPVEVGRRRMRRVTWSAGVMVKHVGGLDVRDGKVVMDGPVKEMEERRVEAVSLRGVQDRVLRQPLKYLEDEEDEQDHLRDDEEDPEVAALRERFQHLQSLLPQNQTRPSSAPDPKSVGHARTGSAQMSSKKHRYTSPTLHLLPGYTTLIFDTNVLLSSLSFFTKLVDSRQYTIIIPLPVITELDGLAKEPPPLGTEARQAITYLEGAVKSKGMWMKIQTSKGSYLSDLSFRSETDMTGDGGRNMDERILSVAKWQLDNFVDRSNLLSVPKREPLDQYHSAAPLNGGGVDKTTACKAVLVTFDRNLRLVARSKGVDAVDEREMASLLGGK